MSPPPTGASVMAKSATESSASSSRTGVDRKLMLRLILPLALLSFVNSIDRVNISFAGPSMMRDLGLSSQQFGMAVSAFFIAYLLFQYPHARLLRAIGIKWWLLSAMLLWGIAGLWMSQVTSANGLYGSRFLLGVAEAGFGPGITHYISRWVPLRLRARAMAGALSAIPLSMVLGGPLCGWLLSIGNPVGWAEWQWMFFLQAIPTIILAFVAALYFVDAPARATWLSEGERNSVEAELSTEMRVGPAPTLADIAGDFSLWRCSIAWLMTMTGAYALVFWMPQVVRQLGLSNDELVVGLISAMPQAALFAGLIFNGRASDRSGERFWHTAVPVGIAGLAMLVAAAVPVGWPALLLLTVASAGIGASQGVFWTLPAALGVGRGRVPVGAIALISMFGTAGGVVGPFLTGVVRDRTGSFASAIATLAFLLIVAALILLPWRKVRTADASTICGDAK